ncbi:MAG: hypothetical protein ACE5KR_01630 [Candidatus Bipolaricaulia bacterium]
MPADRKLPGSFLQRLKALEAAYPAEDGPIRQSGFSSGPERWRAEREPILEAIGRDGGLLDVGCANGFLLECLVQWAGERGIVLNHTVSIRVRNSSNWRRGGSHDVDIQRGVD